MKRVLSALLCMLLFTAPVLAESASGSWGQINQSLSPVEDWQRFVQGTEFHLGEETRYDATLYLCDYGTYPSIDGSTVCVPMAMEFARQWLRLEENDLNGFVNFSTTPYAYDRLIQRLPNPTVTIRSRGIMMDETHPVDIVLGTGPNADERKAADDEGVNLVMVPVCYDAFVFLVNGNNPVTGMTSEQIREVYAGNVENWDQLGGNDGLIRAYVRPHGSGSQTAMEEMVMADTPIGDTVISNYIADGMADLIAQIGNYDNEANAIGYSYLYYVEGLYRSGDIQVLAVDGVKPTPEALRTGAYPYTVCYYAVYEEGNETAHDFADWITSDEGQACVAQAGYVTLR